MILTVTLNAAVDITYIVEKFCINKVHRTKKEGIQPGGKGNNVAKVVKALGQDVIASGFLGGYNGKRIKDLLKQQNINSDFYFVGGESRLCINVLDPINGTSTEILEKGINIDISDVEGFKEKYERLLREVNVVCLSGGIPQGVPKDIYKDLIEIANKHNVITILDTSNDSLIEGIKGRPFMIKPNIEELEILSGRKIKNQEDVISCIRNYVDYDINLFVVSLGEKGFLVYNNGDLYRVKPPRIQLVNPVGCGDSLVAGFAVGLEKKMKIEDTLKLASAAAASNAQHFGAGVIDYNEVIELFNKSIIY